MNMCPLVFWYKSTRNELLIVNYLLISDNPSDSSDLVIKEGGHEMSSLWQQLAALDQSTRVKFFVCLLLRGMLHIFIV